MGQAGEFHSQIVKVGWNDLEQLIVILGCAVLSYSVYVCALCLRNPDRESLYSSGLS